MIAVITRRMLEVYRRFVPIESRVKFGRFILKRIVPPFMAVAGNRIRTPKFTMYVSPHDLRGAWSFFHYTLRKSLNDEPFEHSLLQAAIAESPGCVFVDIGANFGMHTLEVCGSVAYRSLSRVLAVEPDREVFAHLERSIAESGFSDKALTVNAAVADVHNGSLDFIVHDETSSHNRVLGEGMRSEVSPSYAVRTVTLDGLLEENGIPLAQTFVIKMDIEGSELHGFKGMERTLRKADAYWVFFEMCPRFMEECGYSPYAFAEYVYGLQNDYIAEIDGEAATLTPIDSLSEFTAIVARLLAGGPGETITNILIRREVGSADS